MIDSGYFCHNCLLSNSIIPDMPLSNSELIRETGHLIHQIEKEWKEISTTGNLYPIQKDSLRLMLVRLYNLVNELETNSGTPEGFRNEIPENQSLPEVQIVTEDISEIKDQPEILIKEEIRSLIDTVVPEEAKMIYPLQNTDNPEKTIVESKVSMEIKSEIKTTSIREPYAPKLFDEPVTIASKFSPHESLSEKISKGKKDDSFAERHHKSPLTDLKKSIGINERFAFINELFKGSQQSFHDAIEKLNNAPDYNTASNIMNGELAEKYNWNTKSGIFSELDLLVKRRFGMQ